MIGFADRPTPPSHRTSTLLRFHKFNKQNMVNKQTSVEIQSATSNGGLPTINNHSAQTSAQVNQVPTLRTKGKPVILTM